MHQSTIKREISISGIGLHSGKKVNMKIKPAEADSGVCFVRTDVAPKEIIKAFYNNVENTMLATSIVQNGIEIKTIEHFFAALFGLKIDNVLVEVSGSELPILDGSSKVFIDEIKNAGIVKQNARRKYIRILKNVSVREGDKIARLSPFEGTKFVFDIKYDNKFIDSTPNRYSYEDGVNSFEHEISNARTFGFNNEINFLKKENLIKGGSLDNAILVDDDKILNDTGLRMKDEFVKHKMLDAMGDLSLLNYQILGEYYGFKSGHRLNNQLLRMLMSDESNYEIVELS